MDNRNVRRMKIVLLGSSLASLALLGLVAYQENLKGAWRAYQLRYRERLQATATTDSARRGAEAFEARHQQTFLPELGRIDRCTTCHLGVENPAMVDVEPPLSTHPGELLGLHPVERFGCTICHEGEGRAITQETAHGWDRDWRRVPDQERPLLRGDAVYTSCSRCHYEIDLFGGEQDLYYLGTAGSSAASKVPLDARGLEESLPGATVVTGGKRLVAAKGCLGCHKYRGRGGVLGPDITYVGDKIAHDFDFSHVRGEHTVERWLYEHFMFPAEVSPGTTMPAMGFSEAEAVQLTRYMMSLHRKSAPASHRPPLPIARREGLVPVRGETLWTMLCSACHGVDGLGSTMRSGLWPRDADPWGRDWEAKDILSDRRAGVEVLVPSLNHPDTLAVASEGYLRKVITEGRAGTKMIGWRTEGGLGEDEITLLVDAILRWRSPGPDVGSVSSTRGNPRVGGALYRSNCAACHGTSGEGGIGVSLRSPTFLAVASDAFLRDTILEGRANTAMPAWREFNAQEMSDLLAFIRGWQPARGNLEEALALLGSNDRQQVSPEIGKTLYGAHCVMCHGPDGSGDLAPSLNTQAFLSVASNEYILSTLLGGRAGTAMPAWRHLSSQDLASIVSYLRTWQSVPSRSGGWHAEEVERGDSESGQLLFVRICSGCHGRTAEGATGPQLNNRAFLAVASDRMLLEWISFGKPGTEMRPFLKGGQGIADLSRRQITDIIAYLRSLERAGDDDVIRVAKSPHGRPEKGSAIYAQSCSGCHGPHGEGASGPAIANPSFLKIAPDGLLLATLALGRQGTEMRPVKKSPQSILELSSDEVNDLVAYLRSLEQSPRLDASGHPAVQHRFVVPWDLENGRELFVSNCSGCHGLEGKGSWAPELNNEGFLEAATDGFLQATIVRGRKGTAMRPFGRGSNGLSDLDSDAIDDIVAYIRSWSRRTPSPMTLPAQSSLASRALPSDAGSGNPEMRP